MISVLLLIGIDVLPFLIMPILAIFSFCFVNSHAMYVISIVPVDLAGNSSDSGGPI